MVLGLHFLLTRSKTQSIDQIIPKLTDEKIDQISKIEGTRKTSMFINRTYLSELMEQFWKRCGAQLPITHKQMAGNFRELSTEFIFTP